MEAISQDVMDVPSLELVDDSHFYVSGNVIIHPSAAIAPGVMLQADPGSQLVVAAGVSIGMGTILHAHQGPLILEAGVTLGSGVLIVGAGKIGSQACIGAMTTILNRSVEPKQAIPPGSRLGDDSRSVVMPMEAEAPKPVTESVSPPPADASPSLPKPPASTSIVYGQAYLQRMLITMFPQRQSGLSPPAPDAGSTPTDAEPSA